MISPYAAYFSGMLLSLMLTEKYAAYGEIMSNYEDMRIPKSLHHCDIESFHEYLASYMRLEKREMEYFLAAGAGAVYQAEVQGAEGYVGTWTGQLFSSFERALDNVREGYERDEVERIYVSRYIVDEKEMMSVEVSYDGELLNILAMWGFEGDVDDVVNFLDDFYIDIPIPFKRGDILENANSFDNKHGVAVLDFLCSDDLKRHERLLMRGDMTDMCARVYYISDTHKGLESDTLLSPCNFRYFKGELKAEQEPLWYINRYLKGEIGRDAVLAMQNELMREKTTKWMDAFLELMPAAEDADT